MPTEDLVADHGADAPITVRVQQVAYEAEGIVSLRLERPDRSPLPCWDPGSHIDLILRSGLVRQYSLCGDVGDTASYRIAVLREQASRGASKEVHDSALVGQLLDIRGPRNHFSLVPAAGLLFIAGGIGVTPIVPMIHFAQAEATPWRLFYGGRSREHMAFLEEVQRYGGHSVSILPEDEVGLPNLDEIVGSADPGTDIYACGPPAMLTALERRCEERGVRRALHLERFTVEPGDGPDGLATADDEHASFEAELARRGLTITVPSDRTILRCVRDVVPSVIFSCEDGYCGTCETRVLEGTPDHSDTVLTDSERAENRTMMICVSRSKGPRLVLDV